MVSGGELFLGVFLARSYSKSSENFYQQQLGESGSVAHKKIPTFFYSASSEHKKMRAAISYI